MASAFFSSLPPWLLPVLAILLAYGIGSFPTGYLLVKWRTGQDIREHGSGGTGATNVRRLAGSGWARVALAIDLLKAFVPVLLSQWAFAGRFEIHALVAFAVVIGHSRSVFLNFTGGKSAASGLGTILALDWRVALISAVIAYGLTRLTRIVSVGSILAAIAAPLLMVAFGAPWAYSGFALVSSLYVILRHRQNIVRIFQGTENRLE